MKEKVHPEPLGDMAYSLASQGQAMLKCGAEANQVTSAAGYDPRPWARQARDAALLASEVAVDAVTHGIAADAHLRAAEAMEGRSSEAFRMGWEQEAKNCAGYAARHREDALAHQKKAAAMASKPGMLKSLLGAARDLLVKAQVKGYTKADGTVVQQYSNKVAAAQPVQHGLKMHPNEEAAGQDMQARRAGLEAEGFKHQKSETHAFGENHHFAHDDGRKAMVAKMAPGVGENGQTGVNSFVKGGGAAAAPAKAAKKPAKTLLIKQAKDELAAAGKGTGSFQKAADLFGQAGDQQKAAEATALAKRYGHDEAGQKAKGESDMKKAGAARDEAKAATSPEHKAALEELADAYEARSKSPEDNALTKKISNLNDKAAMLGADQPSAKGAATGATPKQLELMESSLANDEEGSDEEMCKFFVEQGVPEAVAKQAVSHRDAFMTTAVPKAGLLAELMQKDASGKGGSVDAGDVPRETGGGAEASPDAPRPGAARGEAPPQADANEAGWDNLPDEENPKYAMNGMGSKALGRLATMKPEHAKAHAHAQLAGRGMDSDGNWKGFEEAKAHHAGSMPSDFTEDPEIGEHMQMMKNKVLTAAAGGHLDLQKRARHQLAGRGHDTNGNWVGFKKAKELHGTGGGDKLAKADTKTLLFVAAGDADLRRRVAAAGGA